MRPARHIFGVSAIRSHITDALHGDPEIQFVPAMHEPGCLHAAAHKAKRGSRFALAPPALSDESSDRTAYAYKESIPLIALSSDVWSREAERALFLGTRSPARCLSRSPR
jgi:thiamine pyrophosphate-dependent acetolactate synthase large subunit-like protein